MDGLRGVTWARAAVGITALIVVGGFVVALISSSGISGGPGGGSLAPSYMGAQMPGSNFTFGHGQNAASYVGPGYTQVVGQTGTVTALTTTTYSTTTGPTSESGQPSSNVTQGSPKGLIEFSSDLTLRTSDPQQTASGVAALAYAVGGYVAYQSTYSSSAYVVIRVPASQYQAVTAKVEAMGTVVSVTSTSNDVRVQYTDLNATLVSLQTEQGALLKLLNESTTVNSTLAIESQLQGVDQQVNEVESEMLQARTLIDYSTINVTIQETARQAPLSVALSASPKTGIAPLSITFNALVKGGAQPYVINYNFGDGYAAQGQTVIHAFFQAGVYNVTVGVTDQEGNTTGAWTLVHVSAAQAQSGIGAFIGNVGGLFLSVVEGIVEVAVVVLPIAAVGALIVVPIQRRGRKEKALKQS